MKDYTLSEAKKICEEHRTCDDCPLKIITQRGIGCMFWIMPRKWQNDFEQPDVIELPCKEHFVYKHDDGHITENWRVFYRAEFALIGTAVFPTEPEADAFLADLKGGKR